MGREKLKAPQEPAGPPPPSGQKVNKPAGRPSSTKNAPYKSDRKMTPIGGREGYCMSKVKEGYVLAQNLEVEVSKVLREKHDVKRLTKQQKEVALQISNIVMANEEPENWKKKISTYCKNPTDKNRDRVAKVQDVACEHQLDTYLASILYASRVG